MRWLTVVVLGAVLGAVISAGDDLTTASPDYARALGIVSGLGAVWAATGVLSGWLLAKAPWSVLGGWVAFGPAIATYWIWGHQVTGHVDWTLVELNETTRFWALASLILAPALGLLGGVARTQNAVGTAARLLVPLIMMLEMPLRYPLSTGEFRIDPVQAWTTISMVAVGALAAAIALVNQGTSSQSRLR